MLNPGQVRNLNKKSLISATSNNRGFALLMMLGLILIAFTTIAVTHLSKNSNQLKQKALTIKAMARARDAIMAFSISQTAAGITPGTLPCPDVNGDGVSDPVVGACSSVRGLVPFQTLGLMANTDSTGRPILYLDGTGAPIWYVVPAGYAGSSVGLRNSSLPSVPGSSLTVFVNSLSATQSMAFILIAPGIPVNGQQPRTAPLAPVTEFLEGENANASLATYDDLQDASHNDQIMGVPAQTFWSTAEAIVLDELKSEITTYRNQCLAFPWAANFGSLGDASVMNNYQGWVPLTWGASCPPPNAATPAPPAAPTWLATNWTHMIYYAICNPPVAPANPPIASCISFIAPGTTGAAKVILMAPGTPIGALTRPPGAPLSNFYEGVNNITDNTFINLRPANHTNAANDLISIVAP